MCKYPLLECASVSSHIGVGGRGKCQIIINNNLYQKNLLVKLHLFSLVEPWWAWQFEMVRGTQVIYQIWCGYEERQRWEWGKETHISLLLVVHFLQFIITGYRKCADFPLLAAICHSIYSQLLLFGCPKILCSYSLLGSITAQFPPLLLCF